MVKDEYGLHEVRNPVGAAAELVEQTPALQDGFGVLVDAADLGKRDQASRTGMNVVACRRERCLSQGALARREGQSRCSAKQRPSSELRLGWKTD